MISLFSSVATWATPGGFAEAKEAFRRSHREAVSIMRRELEIRDLAQQPAMSTPATHSGAQETN